nr:hypothetical protein CFP56_43695 [Quercus suber]
MVREPLPWIDTSLKHLLGNWKHDAVRLPQMTLENAERRLAGEEKVQFLRYVRKMLQWKPEDRCGWEDVFWDEWLLADLIESGVLTGGED